MVNGMNKERLEELREETTQYRAVADDRCMSTQYEDDILALIDAEIARQSVTDEAVQRALSELGFETLFELESWWCKHGSLAITALRQMKPSKWIPVSERLPEPISQTSGANIKNTYLVARYENCNPKGYFYGYQLARYWKSGWSGTDGSYGLSVTHWMPLPKPPESEG